MKSWKKAPHLHEHFNIVFLQQCHRITFWVHQRTFQCAVLQRTISLFMWSTFKKSKEPFEVPWILKVLHGIIDANKEPFIIRAMPPGLEPEQHLDVCRREHVRLTGAVGSVTLTSYSTNATAVCLFAPMSRLCDTPLCCACLNCPTQLALISDSVRMSKHGVSNPSLCPPWRLAAHENPPKSTTPANRQRKPNASRFLSKQVPVNDKSFVREMILPTSHRWRID